jgi:hypothetical protein
MHINTKVLSMDAVIDSGGILAGVGICLKLRQRISYRIAQTKEHLQSISFLYNAGLARGERK